MSEQSDVMTIRETLAGESEKAQEDLKTAFYDLCGFAMKELKTARKYLTEVEHPEKVREDTLVKVAKAFLARAERYAEAKKALRERATIVMPDAPTVLRTGLS